MSLWQFSESSQPLLRQCIEAAPIDINNKWVQKFGIKTGNFDKTDDLSHTNIVNNNINEDIESSRPSRHSSIDNMDIDENPNCLQENEELWREIIELEPIAHFNYIMEKCLQNKSLYLFLAKELPLNTIEKLCKHIYVANNIHLTFLENFYTLFFPAFLKREPTRLSLDLLVKAKCHVGFFQCLLVIIVKDVELPSSILYDYVSTLNIDDQTDFMVTLSQFDMPKEVFLHHLATFHTVYKTSQKTSELQNFILIKLSQISENCLTDKNYGRFLLNFLQAHTKFQTNISDIENIVEIHRSAFKKLCLNVLNEIKNVNKNNLDDKNC